MQFSHDLHEKGKHAGSIRVKSQLANGLAAGANLSPCPCS